ncbi:hypothetical protein [Flavobacterium daemonense]|uniref:hypothetical protein n=1 Tax=Flavobacterium daemonense TaxID=1393049 RepID=UPI0011860BAC|nr:hypothetical protein [Flavobacterium daemonense]KAF2335445.1 hypothetical protein FND99_04605 [Flavobacterium daemonense]
MDSATLLTPIAHPDFFSDCAGLMATSQDITANDNGTVNTLGKINKKSIDLDPAIAGIQTSKTVVNKGTFTYNDTSGKITFLPIDNTVNGTITIDYTFNDTYGKTSNVSTITYTGDISHKPADAKLTKQSVLEKHLYGLPIIQYLRLRKTESKLQMTDVRLTKF